MGFKHAACGPLVRSSYHADKQAHGEDVQWFGETKKS
jgi:lipoyl synthase